MSQEIDFLAVQQVFKRFVSQPGSYLCLSFPNSALDYWCTRASYFLHPSSLLMSLSLCMIVKNEANQLPRCLESVRSAVDEIVVVDTGSTDQTVAIAHSFGAAIYSFAWTGDFSAARNESLTHATSDWILVLDADEVLVTETVSLLKQAIQQPDYLVINLLRHEIGAVQSPYSLVSRLFRRHSAIQFSRPYHAMIDDSVIALRQREPHWQVVDLTETAILHYGYEPGAIASRDKLQTARTTMEAYLANHPNDPYECSKLGALYVQLGDFERGINLLKHGLTSVERISGGANSPSSQVTAPVVYELHYHLGTAYSRLKQSDLAAQHYHQAIKQPIVERLKLGAYNNLGSLMKVNGDLNGAKFAYETCVAIAPEFALGHYNLGTTIRALGNITDAIVHYQTALRLNPDHAEAHQNLGVALLKLGRVEESLASFGRAIALHSHHNPQQAEHLRRSLKEMGFQL